MNASSPHLLTIIDDLTSVPPTAQGGVVVIGNFDGVHKGHQKVIADARGKADTLGVPLGVMVFEPLPVEYFGRVDHCIRLAPLTSKAHMLADYGVDYLFVVPFNADTAALEPGDFVLDLLADKLKAVHVTVGYDFRFGKGRAGDDDALRHICHYEGMGVTIVAPVKDQTEDQTYSSTLIRKLLTEGKPDKAAELLGHPWYVEGPVIKGDQRGRTIGFPTANISMADYLEPKFGVYAVTIEIEDGDHAGQYKGVANLGRRPTFDKEDVMLEVFLFDCEGDLYGATARVSFMAFLRPEQKFDGLDALKTQISKDSDDARRLLEQ